MCNTNQAATAWASLLQHGFEGVQLLPYGVPSNDERSALEREMSQDRHWLARQLDHLALGENDLVILDTPTGRTAYLQQALDVADQVLVVTTADAASFITMDQMDRLLEKGACLRLLPPLSWLQSPNQKSGSIRRSAVHATGAVHQRRHSAGHENKAAVQSGHFPGLGLGAWSGRR